ncbi:MFS transporter [Candidatus Mycoplasma haematobovis]|nr:MFS transporter [Candidatus Mycoplasma haematobovis]
MQIKTNFLETATEQQKFRSGLIMWFLLFFGYMFFCVNWLIMSKVEDGWKGKFSLKDDNQTLLESVNYSLYLARGIATIGVSWLMVKLTHKYAVILAMVLNTAAFPLVFSSSLPLFIVGRVLMACGGTMLIIFIQPVLSKFFSLGAKGVLTIFSSWAYVLGALLVNLLFISTDVKKILTDKWQICVGVAGLMTYFPVLYYCLFGKNFDASPQTKEIVSDKPDSYLGLLKEKDCWLWIFFYSFMLVVSVMVSSFATKVLLNVNSELKGSVGKADWASLYTIIFYVFCLFGFFLGRFTKPKIQRKPIVVLACTIVSLLWFIVLVAARAISNPIAATVIIYICVALIAFFGMGIQTVILYIPHEYSGNENPKRITTFYSCLWGIGYILFAIYYFITSRIFDAHPYYGYMSSAFVIMLFMLLYGAFSLLIKEPRPDWPMFPWGKVKENNVNL